MTKNFRVRLNPDRADVIIPATRIYLNAMKWSGARHIYVPKIGLSDGIVKANMVRLKTVDYRLVVLIELSCKRPNDH
jgi:exopolyphosphatase/pppGpp-phosphohydrolase